MGFNSFDGIIYVNLSHRTDRNQRILDELGRQNAPKEKTHRIDAVFDPLNGHRGCALSHIKALDYAIEKKWNNVLILEDDCTFTREEERSREILSEFKSTLENEWDVFLIGGRILSFGKTPMKGINKVYSARCSHAYVVNSHYFKKLRSLYETCVDLMKNELFFIDAVAYAIDNKWDTLMEQDRWYFIEIFAQQCASFSDICIEHRDRTVKEHFD